MVRSWLVEKANCMFGGFNDGYINIADSRLAYTVDTKIHHVEAWGSIYENVKDNDDEFTGYGRYGNGKKVVGVIRSTVWVGPDGIVRKHWRRVAKAADNAARLRALACHDRVGPASKRSRRHAAARLMDPMRARRDLADRLPGLPQRALCLRGQ